MENELLEILKKIDDKEQRVILFQLYIQRYGPISSHEIADKILKLL